MLLVVLVVLGFAGNYFALRLFAGFNYLFGSIAVMLVLRLFGVWWAIPAAIAASCWTVVLFGHPYAMIWLCGEALFVGMLIRRGVARNLILCDTLYWLFVGAPLIGLFFRHVMDVPLHGTVAAMLMYTVIGITNALAASLVLTMFSPRETGGVFTCAPPPIPMQSLIFNVLMTIVAIPALIV
ncbi:MAG: PAS domain S-box protein, partial [Deltaproteobacteria bacterium]|nr:PAS domain S-box protein [Deltaproteobacteria bacterium]